jgi:hypothetical protein
MITGPPPKFHGTRDILASTQCSPIATANGNANTTLVRNGIV